MKSTVLQTIIALLLLTLNSSECVVNRSPNENLMQTHKVNYQNQSFKTVNLVENNDELIYLSELPLDKLLKVKKAIDEIIKVDKNDLVYNEDYDDDEIVKRKSFINTQKWLDNQQNANRKTFHKLFSKDKQNVVTPPSALPLINNYNHNFIRYAIPSFFLLFWLINLV